MRTRATTLQNGRADFRECAKEPSGTSLVRLVGFLSLRGLGSADCKGGLRAFGYLGFGANEVAAVGDTSTVITHRGGQTQRGASSLRRTPIWVLSHIHLVRGLASRLSERRPDGSEMLQELTHMDRITQLQDEIQNVRGPDSLCHNSTHLKNHISPAPDDNGEQHKLPHHQGKLHSSQPAGSNHEATQRR